MSVHRGGGERAVQAEHGTRSARRVGGAGFLATVHNVAARKRQKQLLPGNVDGSALDGLKAQLAGAEGARERRCHGRPSSGTGGGLRLKKPGAGRGSGADDEPSVHNRGVRERAAADAAALSAMDRPSIHSALERKAQLYDELLASGGGLGDDSEDGGDGACMVDFLRKRYGDGEAAAAAPGRRRSRSRTPPPVDPMEQLERRQREHEAGEGRERAESRAPGRAAEPAGGGIISLRKEAKRKRLMWLREVEAMEEERTRYKERRLH